MSSPFRSTSARRSISSKRGHSGFLKGIRYVPFCSQRRGPCPLHAAHDPRNRSFSVHLGKGVFQCFHPPCGAHGNVLDLWAGLRRLPLYDAAVDLAATFHVELPCLPATEKRNP
jgi:DNA primase